MGRGSARRWRQGRGCGAGENRPATVGAAAEREGTRAPSPRELGGDPGHDPAGRPRPPGCLLPWLPPSLAPSFPRSLLPSLPPSPALLPPARRSCRSRRDAALPGQRAGVGGAPAALGGPVRHRGAAALPPRPKERGGDGRAPPVGGPRSASSGTGGGSRALLGPGACRLSPGARELLDSPGTASASKLTWVPSHL